VATSYTPYQLVYGLHPLMPIEYVMSTISADHRDAKPTRVLTTKIIELEKLHVNKLKTQNNVGANKWNIFLSQQKNTEFFSNLEIMFYGFQRIKNTYGKIQEKMVWSIQGTILLAQQYYSSCFY
jgi:hypothetical protein